MHDPLVVAFEIRRPWPKRQRRTTGPSWSWGYGRGRRWRPGAFMNIAGVRLYWPALITVWHAEPGGADSGTVCKWTSHWRWHAHHWRIQVHPLQNLRRWALTRCAWCGGPSRRGGRVNVSHQWDGPRGRWWQGAPGLYHQDCSLAKTVWNRCTCSKPNLGEWGDGRAKDHGTCGNCGRFRTWRIEPWQVRQAEDLRRDVPFGTRPSADAVTRARATYQASRDSADRIEAES